MQSPQAGEIASFIADEGQPVEYGEDVVELAPFFGGAYVAGAHTWLPSGCLVKRRRASRYLLTASACKVSKWVATLAFPGISMSQPGMFPAQPTPTLQQPDTTGHIIGDSKYA